MVEQLKNGNTKTNMMETYYWTTKEPHRDNTETMQAYLDDVNMLDIKMVDGSYAEGVNSKGERYALHASGNGDSYNHKIEFQFLDDNKFKQYPPTPTESYRMVVMDMSKIEPPKAPEVKEFDIWIGWYHLGQGHHPPSEPQKVATVEATTFKIACWLHELESQAKSIRERMVQPNAYVEDAHFGSLYYNPKTNSNSWVGKYYETREEALETFK